MCIPTEWNGSSIIFKSIFRNINKYCNGCKKVVKYPTRGKYGYLFNLVYFFCIACLFCLHKVVSWNAQYTALCLNNNKLTTFLISIRSLFMKSKKVEIMEHAVVVDFGYQMTDFFLLTISCKIMKHSCSKDVHWNIRQVIDKREVSGLSFFLWHRLHIFVKINVLYSYLLGKTTMNSICRKLLLLAMLNPKSY